MTNDLVEVRQQLAKQAQGYVSQEAAALSGGAFLSIRGGILSFGEDRLPGNQVCAIVLDSVMENTYYGTKYDPDQPSAPTCYAFGRSLDEMAPHPSMQSDLEYFRPENHDCKTCPMNEWGSAAIGRGKACQNRRRLALIPAGQYVPRKGSRDFDLHMVDDPQAIASSDVVFMKLPVTSVKTWAKYATSIAAEHQLPPHGVITRIYVEPHPKWQYEVLFEALAPVSDDLLTAAMRRHEEARQTIVRGYMSPNQYEDRT